MSLVAIYFSREGCILLKAGCLSERRRPYLYLPWKGRVRPSVRTLGSVEGDKRLASFPRDTLSDRFGEPM